MLPRLSSVDIDQEIKEGALAAGAALVAHLGDTASVARVVPEVLKHIVARLASDASRIAALRALAYASCSPLKLDLSAGGVLETALKESVVFLRNNARPLRLQTLATLGALVASQGARMPVDTLSSVLAEATHMGGGGTSGGAPTAAPDSDLQSLALLFTAAKSVCLTQHPEGARALLSPALMPYALALSISPVLQAGALSAVCDFLAAVTAQGVIPFSYTISALLSKATTPAVRAGGGGVASAASFPRVHLLTRLQS